VLLAPAGGAPGAHACAVGCGGPQRHGRSGRRVGEVRIEPGFVDAVEEGAEGVVVALRDRIELVVVAAGALEGQSQHRRADGVHPIGDVLLAELLLDAAAFVRLPVQPVEGGGQALLVGGIRQQVAGQLPGQEPIVGKVPGERANHPVAPRRHVAFDVGLIAVGVGVAREVEPVHRHALAVGRGGEITVDGALVGARSSVRQVRIELGWRGRQSGQVEGEPAEQHRGIGLRLGREALTRQPCLHEPVDAVTAGPRRDERCGGRDRHEGPVRLVLRALLDPAHEQPALVRRQGQVRLGRRHHLVRVVVVDPLDQGTLRRVARLDHEPVVVQRPMGALGRVQPHLGLAGLLVGPVAAETPVRQQRPDLVVEADPLGPRLARRRRRGRRLRRRASATHGGQQQCGQRRACAGLQGGHWEPSVAPMPAASSRARHGRPSSGSRGPGSGR
jgi:hypothetical protein